MCVLHHTLGVERECQAVRMETVLGKLTSERRAEIAAWIAQRGELLARIATGNARISDGLKARILATFLTLMNLREHLERGARRAKSLSNEK